MWRTTRGEWLWVVVMVISSGVAAYSKMPWISALMGLCAGNQLQLCAAGMWWGSLRNIYKTDRKTALELVEDELQPEQG